MSPFGLLEAEAHGVALALAALAEEAAAALGALRDGLLDCLVSVIARVAFDEDDLGVAADVGNAADHFADVAGFVARRDDNGNGRPFVGELAGAVARARDDELGQGQVAERPGLHQVTIAQPSESRNGQRQQDLGPMADDGEVAELEQVVQGVDGEPVLAQGRPGETEVVSHSKRKLPQGVVGVDQQAGARRRQTRELLDHGLDVPHVVDQVGGDDHVERAFDLAEVVNVGVDEAELGMAVPGTGDHLGGEIDTGAFGGLQRGEQVTAAAAQLQDALAGTDQELVYLVNVAVVVVTPARPHVEMACNVIPPCGTGVHVVLVD